MLIKSSTDPLLYCSRRPFVTSIASTVTCPDRSTRKRMSIDVIRRIASEGVGDQSLRRGDRTFSGTWGSRCRFLVIFTRKPSEIARIAQEYGREYVHVFQTNVTLINEDWIALIKKHRVRMGVSLDGLGIYS